MASRFLVGKGPTGQLWACVDADSLTIAPRIAERRFGAYMAPFLDEKEARQALLEAGADPDAIKFERRPSGRRGH